MKETILDISKVLLATLSGLGIYSLVEGGLKLLALLIPTLYTIWKWRKEYRLSKAKKDEQTTL